VSDFQNKYFVLTLPLKTELWQQHVLEKRFEINRQIYNALLQNAMKRYKQMSQTKLYRANKEALLYTTEKKARKKLLQERDSLVAKYQLRNYDICKETTEYRQYFSEHTDSPIVQNLASEVGQAIDGLVKGSASQVYLKKQGQLKSLSGKTNRSSIKFREGNLVWKGLTIPIDRKNWNWYEEEALKREIRYCRIKKSVIRGKDRYFLEIVLKGDVPVKRNEDATGVVGLDIGCQKVEAVTQNQIHTYILPFKNRRLEQKKRELSQYMERSRRSMNPGNYEPNGRIKKGSNHWVYSNKYQKARLIYQELCRKQAVLQKQSQYKLAQEISSSGSCFYIEETGRVKLDGVRFSGVYHMQTAPSGFLKVLEYKLNQQGKQLLFR
jgi:putative transposase